MIICGDNLCSIQYAETIINRGSERIGVYLPPENQAENDQNALNSHS